MDNSTSRCPFNQNHPGIDQFDMLDPHARSCPHAYYKWLQQDTERRVYKVPHERSFYAVHTYDDVKFVLTNNKIFSSAILPTSHSPFLALMDGEDHLRQREIVNKIFDINNSNFPVGQIRTFIEETTKSLCIKHNVDLLESWATPIPLASLCFIFGIEPSDEQLKQLHVQSIIINKALFVRGGTGPRRNETPTLSEKIAISFSVLKNVSKLRKLKKSMGEKAWSVFKKMFRPVKTEFENPRPDFSFLPQAIGSLLDLMLLFNDTLEDEKNISHGTTILRKAMAETRISKVEAIMLCTFILFAGYETSVSLLSNAVYHLSSQSTLFNQLKSNPELTEDFIEESLRFYTPVGRFLRRANEDVIIGGVTIPKGSMVIALLGAANTDPDRFENPYSFESAREKNQHMSFGKGIHFCVGAPLARLQAKMAIAHLVKISPGIKINPESPLEMVTDRDNGILRLQKLLIEIS